MRLIAFQAAILFLLAFSNIGNAQVASVPPTKWNMITTVYARPSRFGDRYPRLIPQNDIRNELLDTNTSQLIAKFHGLSTEDLATIQIAENSEEIRVYQIGKSNKAFDTMSELLRAYGVARDDGHSRAYCIAFITNRTEISSLTNAHLRAFLTNHPTIPSEWVTESATTRYTNKAGVMTSQSSSTSFVNGKFVTTNSIVVPQVDEVGDEIEYLVTDGEIAWVYSVRFTQSGEEERTACTKCDAREFDPRFKQTIKQVKDEVTTEMNRQGINRRRGAASTFWVRVKERLETKGITWRPPSELNLNIRFD